MQACVISNPSIQWSVPTTYDIMYILHLRLFTNTVLCNCVYYSRYIYVCMLSYLFVFTGQSFDPRLHWQVSNLFSAARILCVLISSAVVTTTNSTTTFICSEDAPRKNVHCIFIPNCKYGNIVTLMCIVICFNFKIAVM